MFWQDALAHRRNLVDVPTCVHAPCLFGGGEKVAKSGVATSLRLYQYLSFRLVHIKNKSCTGGGVHWPGRFAHLRVLLYCVVFIS